MAGGLLGGTMKLTLFLMVWNTSHLMARTLETLKKQTIDDWELLIIDDNSEDDVQKVLQENGDGLPIKYHRLEHDMGMRGNTFSLNYGLEHATGDVVMWSTPEVMLPPRALERAYEENIYTDQLMWVTVPSHGLTAEIQLLIDTVDWRSDIDNIKHLLDDVPEDHWNSVWFNLNFHANGRLSQPSRQEMGKEYGNNQTVAVMREQFIQEIGTFPYFLDYGSDDPWISRVRKEHGYRDLTLWDQEAYHQWHPTCQYWMAQGKAPHWNKWGHSTVNILGDSRVPEDGTCNIWDAGKTDSLTDDEKQRALSQRDVVVATGFRYKLADKDGVG